MRRALACGQLFCEAAEGLGATQQPGFRKSKSDQRSERRFSTGVPVNAIRAAARSSRTARLWRVPELRIACASSRITSCRSRWRSHSKRVSMVYVVITRSHPASGALSSFASFFSEGCAMNTFRDGPKRDNSDFQLAISDAGNHQQAGFAAVAGAPILGVGAAR